ncbi:MAG: hypothetical protein R3C60_05980 [Parvularculaceae bacterium]
MRLTFGMAAMAALFVTPALAGEWADACKERLEADGRDTSGCTCLEDEINANPGLEEEFQTLAAIEDPAERYGEASDAAKAAMDACTRK